MGEFIKVTPIDDKRVMDPESSFQAIAKEGQRVRKSAYWKRMEAQGAVSIEAIDDEAKEEEQVPPPPSPSHASHKPSVKKGVSDAV